MNSSKYIESFRQLYNRSGICTMPIPYNKKAKPKKEWKDITEQSLWTGIKYPSNLAVIAGRNDLCIFDPDDEKSGKALGNYWLSLGVKHVGSQSRRGSHMYIRTKIPEDQRLTGKLNNLNGDIIFDGYALAAPSVVNDYQYKLIGTPSSVPFLAWKDIQTLVETRKKIKYDYYKGFPVPVLRRDIPQKIKVLAEDIQIAAKGEPIMNEVRSWESRSEAAFSVMLALLLRGYRPDEIRETIYLPDREVGWYNLSINKAIQEICNLGNRPALARLYNTPIQLPGRTGAVDYAVFLAVVSLAWFLNRFEIFLSIRDIALLSATNKKTASKSLKRIVNAGLIAQIESEYCLKKYFSLNSSFLESLIKDNFQNNYNYISTKTVSSVPINGLFPELWTKESLGKTAFQVYMSLTNETKTYKDIHDSTGRKRSSIFNALNKLSGNGLAIRKGKGWIKGFPIIKELEREFNCAENSKKRRESIMRERKKFYAKRLHTPALATKHRLLDESNLYFMDDSLSFRKQ